MKRFIEGKDRSQFTLLPDFQQPRFTIRKSPSRIDGQSVVTRGLDTAWESGRF